DDQTVLEVEDNGGGVPAEAATRIWDPFWTTKGERGTGLGLAGVRGIISEHAGAVSTEPPLRSRSGARFVVRLSSADAEEATADPASALDVLVVESRAADASFVERFLSSRGHAVLTARSADAARRMVRQTTFDAVVCDARMMDADGSPLWRELERTPGLATARLIVARDSSASVPKPTSTRVTVLHHPYDI